ncbi:IclR family transcriptional regulator [Azorhizobium doebereinerae]|uniref:IclR family transcriptional regulator n=1 Tax=Azorhizobium doebereinerae TaxID=281091 RepID=UPI0003FB8669|nr:IclR family transcriptional regulator [Azorhizobium doebereinerae]
MQERDADTLGGFAKGLAVIEAFDETRQRLTIADVARLTGLDRATSRRCLLTLTRLGYADFDGKFFSLTPRILRLGHAYLASTPLPRIVQPYLERLSEATGESCSCSILDGTEIVYVARASQRRVMSIGLAVGSRLPAYCASMGRVLLAALPPGEAEARLRDTARPALTPRTRTDMADLMAELERVRGQGYALVDEELEIGLRAIAIPVLDTNGAVRAAMNIGCQAARVSPERMIETFLPQMQAMQKLIRSIVR